MMGLRWGFLVLFVSTCLALNEPLGRTPPMGWTSYYFGCNITEESIRDLSDAVVYNGLSSVGYNYIHIDDCWQGNRDTQGNIQPDTTAFPNGMQPVADHIHTRRLLFGLSSDVNKFTRTGRPGSYDYEINDAKTFASWNIDYFKSTDWLWNATIEQQRVPIMYNALEATNRSIFLAFSGTNNSKINESNSWSTSNKIKDDWQSMLTAIDINNEYAEYARPGFWNDPGLLQVGNGGMSTDEYIAHFSLWALSKAPLITGLNIVKLSQTALFILTNPEAIAINQDPLGEQGRKVAVFLSKSSNRVIQANCFRSTSMIEPKLRQWIYNLDDKTIRSTMNNRCLTRTNQSNFILTDCHNQNLIISSPFYWNPTKQTIENRLTRECLTVQHDLEIWSSKLADSSRAVILLNRGDTSSQSITVQWTDIGLPSNSSATIRDLWARADLGTFTNNFTSSNISPHSIIMLKITENRT